MIRCAAAVLAVFLWAEGASANSILPVSCGGREATLKVLDKQYKERLANVGVTGSGQLAEIFVSESGTWTVVLTQANGTSCVIAGGSSWETVPHKGEPL